MRIETALKEWAATCDMLLNGEFALTLRKGGIHEKAGPGRFEMTHHRFLLWPSWEHQNPEAMKPDYIRRVDVLDEPATVTIHGFAEPERIWVVPDRARFERLDDLHPWSPAHLDMRFNYKPDRPLYLVMLAAYRLTQPVTIDNKPVYGGCRSWIPLEPVDHVTVSESTPALDSAARDAIAERVDRAFDSTP